MGLFSMEACGGCVLKDAFKNLHKQMIIITDEKETRSVMQR